MAINKQNLAVIMAQKISRVISGIASEDEVREVTMWANSSPSNLALLKRAIDKAGNTNGVDCDAAWSRFCNRQSQQHASKIATRVRYMVMMVVMMIFGATTYMVLRKGIDVNESKAALENIHPGSDKAILYTNNGEAIELDNKSQGVIDSFSNAYVAQSTVSYVQVDADDIKKESYNRLVVPKGGQYHLLLADSSEVWVNSATEIRYFVYGVGDERTIELEGEAYFKVKPSNKPFVVISKNNRVEVMGTEFNVNSYGSAPGVTTTLLSGKVMVSLRDDLSRCEVLSEPGMQSIASSDISLNKVDPMEFTSWKDGVFYFNHTSLSTIMKRLSMWYDFDYIFLDKSLTNYHFSGEFKRFVNINTILEIIRLTGVPINIDCKNSTLIMSLNK